EFFSSIVNYDSRLRYTLKDLLFKPGTITKNYVQGKRLKYANPFRFFLSISIIYFLIQSLISTFSGGKNPGINFNNNSQKEDVVTLGPADVHFNPLLPKDTLSRQDSIPFKPKEKKTITYYSEQQLDSLTFLDKFGKRFNLYREFYEEYDISNPSQALDSLRHNNTQFNRWLYSKNLSMKRIKENPFGFANYMLGKIPFFLFFFAPFFALFFWLIYSKKKYNYMEHLVFIFHIFGFVFLGLLLCLLPDLLIGDEIIAGVFISLIGPFYFYKALRNFYKQNRFITILKFVFLNVVFFISATFAAILFFAVTAAAY
ncbi:MAG: DUF3667 domain-containing protein, partial [Flavobacteriaceae bacterium]